MDTIKNQAGIKRIIVTFLVASLYLLIGCQSIHSSGAKSPNQAPENHTDKASKLSLPNYDKGVLIQRTGPKRENGLLYKEVNKGSSQNTRTKPLVNFLGKLFWSVTGGFIGAAIALYLEKKCKNPELEIVACEEASENRVFPERPGIPVPGRWKFFRVFVINKPLSKPFSRITTRETAERVHAKITFRQINKTMKGRWALTLDLPLENPGDWQRLANFPEPETIFVGEEGKTILDVFAKHENDTEAYGWNNETYLHKWRTPHYKLNPGDYDIEILLVGLNTQVKKVLRAHVGRTIDDTHLFDPD